MSDGPDSIPAAAPQSPQSTPPQDLIIEFQIRSDLKDDVPRPYPAKSEIPDWYRNMPTEAATPGFSTVKRCPPFLDAMTAGYIIPVPTDITLSVHAAGGGIDIEIANFSSPLVETHQAHQFPGAPFPPNYPVLKFINPWLIKTPPGYCTLFCAPFNRFQTPVLPLAGVVDTDVLYAEVHFPSLCLLAPGASFTLKRGSPLVQLIPFRREHWRSTIADRNEPAAQQWRTTNQHNRHAYKDELWQKKTFG